MRRNRGCFEEFRRVMEEENVEICQLAEELEEKLENSDDPVYRWYLENRLLDLYKSIKTKDDIIELWRGY